DDTITLHQRKLDLLKQLKKGFLQQMFPQNGETTSKLRFTPFAGDWEQRKLKKAIIKNNQKNKELSITNVESVSNKTGFTKQTEQFNDYSVASSDLSNYYLIKEKQFAYNPSRINVGSIAYKSEGMSTSVVSPLYISFYTSDIIKDKFLWYWFKTQDFERQRQALSEGGVRDTLSFSQLGEMFFLFPSLSEQQKIGTFFKQLDETITFYQQKLILSKQLKKGFLQKLFI
ncbi:restriction endonuclease subunit S, partial [Liquorilactobacillus hordei]|uniref:restriction endonuclease subunit S n=1 Tax=Liquorilactobacillus hordei TaxID=468911 RepID=UPI0039EBF5E7